MFRLVDCRQNLNELGSALETFRNAELELKDCRMDYERCASSIAIPSIFFANTLFFEVTVCYCFVLDMMQTLLNFELSRTMALMSSIHWASSIHSFQILTEYCKRLLYGVIVIL